MITSLSWIPKGAARSVPVRYELSAMEIKKLKKMTLSSVNKDEDNNDDNNADEGIDQGRSTDNYKITDTVGEDDDDLPPELRMNDYDDDEDEEFLNEEQRAGEDDDDHLAIIEEDQVAYADEDEWDEEDLEDNVIKPTDSLILVAMTEDEFSHLEVQLLSDDGNLYVHHDITLPDFPLSLAWLDCPPFVNSDGAQTSVGSYVAVGTFSPAIEIWNLDVLDPLEPTAVLGGIDKSAKKQQQQKNSSGKKGKKQKCYLPGSHQGPVMSLSWNSTFRQALASGSADSTVKIWDVTTQACSFTLNHHTDKVQSVSWHPHEAWLLATGSFDKTVQLVDARSLNQTLACVLTSDIESITWDPFNQFHMYCALEDGTILCVDVRKCGGAGSASNNAAVQFSFQAHEQTTSSLSFSCKIPGMLATASIDKTVKIWDVCPPTSTTRSAVASSASGSSAVISSPREVAYKTMSAGKLFTMQFSPDDPYLLAAAGDTGVLAVWESDELHTIETYFKDRVVAKDSVYTSLTGVGRNSSSSSSNSKDEDVNTTDKAIVTTGELPNSDAFNDVAMIIADRPDDSWMDDNNDVSAHKDAKKKKPKKKKVSKNI